MQAKTFNLLTYRTQDDAPFFSPRPAASPYTSATVPVERDGCEKVTRLMLRSNIQVRRRHFIHFVEYFTFDAPSSTNIFIISVGEACSSLDPGRSLRVWRYSLFEGAQEQCSSFTVIVVMFSVTKLYITTSSINAIIITTANFIVWTALSSS